MAEKETKKSTKKQSDIKKGQEPKFSKAQIIKSQKFATRRDALNAILKDSEKYSLKEVDAILKKFDEGGKK